MKFQIKNRWSGEVRFECELDASFDGLSYGLQLGAAVKVAISKSANLSDADLSRANLRDADLSRANLRDADLSRANLRDANLSRADLSRANLRDADLRDANLSRANLSDANLSRANLSDANLSRADLSQSKNFPTASAWLAAHFEKDAHGWIVFRSQPGQNAKPDSWKFEPGAFLTEVPNPDRCTECGSGVNFATLAWAKANYKGPYWKCRIRWEDCADIIVPFGTDGKARCAKLELIETI